MQQSLHDTDNLNHKRKLYLIGIVIFSLLLFCAVGLFVMLTDGIKDFYQRKMKGFDQTSIEAVIPASQASDKLIDLFENEGENEVSTKKALSFDHVTMKIKGLQSNEIMIMDLGSSKVHYAKGNGKGSNKIVLPYICYASYGIKKNSELTMIVNGQRITYTVSGFYEDEILSQQSPSEFMVVYVDTESFQRLQTIHTVIDYSIMSIKVKDISKSNSIIQTLKDKVDEELFIGGLSLKLFSGQEIKENTNLYLSYVKKVMLGICAFFFVLSILGVSISVHGFFRYGDMESEKGRNLCFGVIGANLVVGNIIVLLLGSEFLSYLISNVGYPFKATSTLLCILISSVVYILIAILLFELVYRSVGRKEKINQNKLKNRSMFDILKKGSVLIGIVSLFISMIVLLGCLSYHNLLGETDLLYKYNDSQEVVEVFHSNDVGQTDLLAFRELTDYGKPLFKTALFALIIGGVVCYLLALLKVLTQIAEVLRDQGEKSPGSKALPILGILLLATLLGYLVSVLIVSLGLTWFLTMLGNLFGVVIHGIVGNIGLYLFVFGGFLIIASGTTLVVIR